MNSKMNVSARPLSLAALIGFLVLYWVWPVDALPFFIGDDLVITVILGLLGANKFILGKNES